MAEGVLLACTCRMEGTMGASIEQLGREYKSALTGHLLLCLHHQATRFARAHLGGDWGPSRLKLADLIGHDGHNRIAR